MNWNHCIPIFISRLPVLLLAGGLFFGCGHPAEELQSFNLEYDSLSVERARDVKIRYSDSGQLKATIVTPLLERYPQEEDPYMEMSEGLKAYFYDDAGKQNSSIKADYAISYDNTKIITLKRNVRVKNAKDEELETEELHWNQKNKTIYSDQFVKIRRKDEILFGRGFESNETFTKYKIKKPEGKFTINEGS